MRNKLIAFLIVLALVATAVPALAHEPTAGEIMPDVFIVRPLSLAATALGAVMFVVALPVSIPTGSVKQVGQELVVVPFKYTFVRPVGAFD